jgi:hypothetical protein
MIHWWNNTNIKKMNYSKNLTIGSLPSTNPTFAGLKSIRGLYGKKLVIYNMSVPLSGIVQIA